MNSVKPPIQMWVCYVGKESQPAIDNLRNTLFEQENIRLKSFATKIQNEVESVGTEDDEQIVQYELTNGQKIHELTNEIAHANAVGVFLSPGFIKSKYCCLELAGLLRRSDSLFPEFFIHCSTVDIKKKPYRDKLARAMAAFVEAEGDYLVERAGQFQKKPDDSTWEEWLKLLLDDRAEGVIHSYGDTAETICPDISGYRRETIMPWLEVCDVPSLYSDWINRGQRKTFRDFLNGDEDLLKGKQNHQVLATDVFMVGKLNDNSIGWLVQRLGSYADEQRTPVAKKRAEGEIRMISGFLALTFLEPTWVASLVEKSDESVILHLPVKALDGTLSGTAPLYSAMAISMVSGKVPRLKLGEDIAMPGIEPIEVLGGVRLGSMPGSPDTDGKAWDKRDKQSEQLLREFYKEAYDLPDDRVPEILDEEKLRALHGRLTGYSAAGKAICHVEFDQGTFSQFANWSGIVGKALARLNAQREPKVELPFIMFKRGETDFDFNSDSSRRIEPLRELIEIAEQAEQ